MTSNTDLFTAPIKHMLSEYLYGEVTLRRFHTVFCEETCREWIPFDGGVFQPSPWETWESYEAKFDYLVEAEEESRTCQGHLELHDEFRGMLRNYTYQPASDDRERDGTLSLIVLPWDDEAKQLTRKRTIRARVFSCEFRESTMVVLDGDGSTSLHLSLKQWEIGQR